VRRDGNRLVLEGAATAGTVAALLDAGAASLRDGVEVVDFGAVTEVDSAAVALALAWLRAAHASRRTLSFDNLPPALLNLARLYGVDELIPRVPR
jgi:phospholipid transport system transporter-binding protein